MKKRLPWGRVWAIALIGPFAVAICWGAPDHAPFCTGLFLLGTLISWWLIYRYMVVFVSDMRGALPARRPKLRSQPLPPPASAPAQAEDSKSIFW